MKILALALALSAVPTYADCYRCTINPDSVQLECRAQFNTGGDACTTAPNSCWTNDKCNCSDQPLDRPNNGDGDCDSGGGDTRPVGVVASYHVSEAGRRVLSALPGATGAILRDMVYLSPRLPLGGIRSGYVRHEGKFLAFKGRLKMLPSGNLYVTFSFHEHPVASKVELTIGDKGVSILWASVTDRAGVSRDAWPNELP